MPIVQNQPTIHGKRDIHLKQESVCATFEKQIEGNTETTAPNQSKMMQKFCRDGKFSEHVLSRITEIVKTYI